MKNPPLLNEAQSGTIDRIAYRIDDAANAIGLSRSTIYELINAGKLRSVKAAGRRLILAEDLKAFLLAGEEGA